MPDVPQIPDSNGDTGDETGAPRWVWVLGTIAFVLVVLFVILNFVIEGLGVHGVQQP